MQIDTLLIRNIAYAEYKCRQNIENVVRVNKDHTRSSLQTYSISEP